MDMYRKSSHATYRCEYHFVWVPKYRYKILIGDVKHGLQKILYQLCEWLDIMIIEGTVCSDHVHMYLSIPPKYSPSYVMKILKGKSAERLMEEYPAIMKKCWSMHVWARGYFVSTVGIDREVIKNYVRNQEEEQINEDQIRIWKDVR